MKRISLLFVLCFCFLACYAKNVDVIKQNAKQVLEANGFEIIGYQGYQWGCAGTYGGCVWYTLKRGNITYEACISKWGDEYHIYNLKALDAIPGGSK